MKRDQYKSFTLIKVSTYFSFASCSVNPFTLSQASLNAQKKISEVI